MTYPSRFALISLIALAFISALPAPASALTLAEKLSGKILLDVQSHGEGWYVYPKNLNRYFLGRPQNAFDLMRLLGLGISNADLSKIPSDADTYTGDAALRKKLSGRILLQVEAHGEAWYVFPGDQKRYFLGRPDDAFHVMSRLGLGVTEATLNMIPVAGAIAPNSRYENKSVTTERGTFSIGLITLPRDLFAMVTDTGDNHDCANNCTAKSLQTYVQEAQGRIGIHGTYFCPPDYADCATKVYSYNWPVFNSLLGIMINEVNLKFHNGPIMVYTTDGQYQYFHRAIDFGHTVAEFEKRTGKKVAAAIANYPSLVENGQNIVAGEPMIDDKQRTVKGPRAGIGYDDKNVYLVVAKAATVIDLASIFKTMGVTTAMNLDGGGSTALYEDTYKFGPGRLLPNAIIFKGK